jgi:hypothetical protein
MIALPGFSYFSWPAFWTVETGLIELDLPHFKSRFPWTLSRLLKVDE